MSCAIFAAGHKILSYQAVCPYIYMVKSDPNHTVLSDLTRIWYICYLSTTEIKIWLWRPAHSL